ncbi:MAG: family 10 glycosylhydrolase [Sphingobacteriaceae bacterium]|nr:family 10 glycosylhydrolase [Sphingobacteriaceae bacterium]
MLKSIISAVFCFSFIFCLAQNDPKREFRGVWVATVSNIDWPSKQGLSTEEQKKELIDILNLHKKNGFNAIFLQIRPTADAFYTSSSEPWSKYLMGQQGVSPMPLYDPLAFAIAEAHKRGMELHAWFNPYRATMNAESGSKVAENHITKTNPELFYAYGGQLLFNPGLPEVQDYIIKIVLDVVNRYDIDGVHFDDYFYPYPIKGQNINDKETFEKYNNGFTSIGDWRRDNVDRLIKSVNDSVHFHKKHVKFGVSPFGIWRNKKEDFLGSKTDGLSNYEALFADSRKWIKEGWVDYINPQIYFTFSRVAAPFGVLVDWWAENSFDRHLYIGQAAYLVNESKSANAKAWQLPNQIPDQIKYIRNKPQAQGSVFFSSKSFSTVAKGLGDSLRKNHYKHPALPPQMPWLDSVYPNKVRNLMAESLKGNIKLTWKEPFIAEDGETASGYVIYRFNSGEPVDITSSKNILSVKYNNEPVFIDETTQKGQLYVYMVTALDRLKNESEASDALSAMVD